MARREGRRPRTLDEWDFLLGVNDTVRMGALRLADGDGAFLDAGPLAVPPITRLRELESAARRTELGTTQDDDAMDWLNLLIAPGSSLGGARPKANFVAEDGTLWIAKFPSQADRHDVGAWEFILARLAVRAGITMPDIRLLDLGGEYHTFAAQRFDRSRDMRRLYVSAMTLVGTRDGSDASYLDLALAIQDHGAYDSIDVDLEQLFRRLVFNVVMSNRDDHLRNHGFLRTPNGWRLAPAFDMNPAPEKTDHSLAIDDRLGLPDLALVRDTRGFYRLSPARADAIIEEVSAVVADWRSVATREAGLHADEMDFVARGFLV
jgi:serine/threonine-protein kinase HipA